MDNQLGQISETSRPLALEMAAVLVPRGTEDFRTSHASEYMKDLEASHNAYDQGFEAALKRNQLSPSAAEASWAKAEASLSDMRSKLSLRSSGEIDPTRQVPLASLTADKSSPSTKTRPSSDLEAKYGASGDRFNSGMSGEGVGVSGPIENSSSKPSITEKAELNNGG